MVVRTAVMLITCALTLQGCSKGTTTLVKKDGNFCRASTQISEKVHENSDLSESRSFSAVLECEADPEEHDGSRASSTLYRNVVENGPRKSCRVTTLDCGDADGPHRPNKDEITYCNEDDVEALLKRLCAGIVPDVSVVSRRITRSKSGESLAAAYSLLRAPPDDKELPEDGMKEQGFHGDNVAHKDGETMVENFGQEYGPNGPEHPYSSAAAVGLFAFLIMQ